MKNLFIKLIDIRIFEQREEEREGDEPKD